MTAREDLLAHLKTGTTTVCRCWSVTRRDGIQLGFTDHDRDLNFDAVIYRAATGMTAKALQLGTGLSVDNSEAMGALSDTAISEADIAAGRFDGADVVCWLVNWADLAERMILFRGSFGEITRAAGAFNVELRGLTDPLNQPRGRVYVKTCSAVLGDSSCGFDLEQAGFSFTVPLLGQDERGRYLFSALDTVEAGWLSRGPFTVISGQATGLVGVIKFDQTLNDQRVIELWTGLNLPLAAGDTVRLEAGCDKVAATCQSKFNNFNNFRGFPHLPSEDWLTSCPVAGQKNDGGSLS
jgi:uncharacterized phage protein (TIGR02218 family)